MRLATLRVDGATRAARIDGADAHLLEAPDVGALLASGTDWADARVVDTRSVDDLDLAPVVPRPGKIFCVGLNYKTHIIESGEEIPAYPTLFAKFADTLLGPNDPIVLPDARTDWEGELVAVIGATVRHASLEAAAAAIAGFTVGNDVSVRTFQARTSQWLQGKCFEATAPVGPHLVTVDELGAWPEQSISLTVDGVVKQKSTTADLLFSPPELVAYISQVITLRPGDLIFTGTPGGVGQSRSPQEFLRPGQIVEVAVDGIGSIRNRCCS